MIDVLHSLSPKDYKGDISNKMQYNYLKEKTINKKIVIVGDLLNDYMLETKYKAWSISRHHIKPPPLDRFIVLYYKNEYPNKFTIKDEEFYLFYQILFYMLDKKLLKSFNKLKVICRHSVPKCFSLLDCEKISTEIGPREFELYCNLYANTIFFSSATANSFLLGSRPIVSRNIYEMKKTDRNKSILFNRIYCPVDLTNQYTHSDEFVWLDDTRATYRERFNSLFKIEQSIKIEDKVAEFIQCVLNLDNNPLTI